MAKQITWTLECIQAGLKRFFDEKGRYPTATEFDECQYLPRAKTIERRFGGLIALRKRLSLGSNVDLRTGIHSSERAHTVNERAHAQEKKVHTYLIKRFGTQFVHREYFFSDDHRTRADFFVYDTDNGFCVDVFFPNSKRNLTGCLNIKLKKYAGSAQLLTCPVIYLQMNANIAQRELDSIVSKKKRALERGHMLMDWRTFKRFCESKKPLRIAGAPLKQQV